MHQAFSSPNFRRPGYEATGTYYRWVRNFQSSTIVTQELNYVNSFAPLLLIYHSTKLTCSNDPMTRSS